MDGQSTRRRRAPKPPRRRRSVAFAGAWIDPWVGERDTPSRYGLTAAARRAGLARPPGGRTPHRGTPGPMSRVSSLVVLGLVAVAPFVVLGAHRLARRLFRVPGIGVFTFYLAEPARAAPRAAR